MLRINGGQNHERNGNENAAERVFVTFAAVVVFAEIILSAATLPVVAGRLVKVFRTVAAEIT